jgi:hypothetical protein
MDPAKKVPGVIDIFSVEHAVKKYTELTDDIHAAFIDNKEALNEINRKKM